MGRTLLWIGLVFAAIVTLVVAIQRDAQITTGQLLLNLGTELIGIAITVAIVERLIEQGRNRTEAKRMGWDVLQEIDHAVWVWQGGRRLFDLSELLGLLDLVNDTDPIPEFTQNLFMRIGSRSQGTLLHNREPIQVSRDLRRALEALAPLAGIRDHGKVMPPREIATHLRNAIGSLSQVTAIEEMPVIEKLQAIRNPSVPEQHQRHFGKPVVKT